MNRELELVIRLFLVIAVKMPVFHTKTIESILDPVAQQVTY